MRVDCDADGVVVVGFVSDAIEFGGREFFEDILEAEFELFEEVVVFGDF